MIREAKIDDLESLLAIYNEGIMNGTANGLSLRKEVK
jgi:L-amino acid N-acyltransferase YncA